MAALHHTAAHARAHGTHECLSRQRLVEVRSTVGTQRVPPRSGATKGAPRAAVPPPFILPSTLLTWLLSLLPHHKSLKGPHQFSPVLVDPGAVARPAADRAMEPHCPSQCAHRWTERGVGK